MGGTKWNKGGTSKGTYGPVGWDLFAIQILPSVGSNTIREWVSDQGRPRAARAAKNKNPFSVFLGPQIMKKKCDHCLTIIYIHFENNRNCFWSPKNKKSDLYGNMPYKRTVHLFTSRSGASRSKIQSQGMLWGTVRPLWCVHWLLRV